MARLDAMDPRQRGRRGRRPFGSHPLRKRFLIVCEGAVTEVRYFEAFPVRREVHVAVRGEGKNTTSLVAVAVEHADHAKLGELLRSHCDRADGYAKNAPGMYELLRPHQSKAIDHAKRLAMAHGIAPHGATTPADANPCTTVFRLVEALDAEIR